MLNKRLQESFRFRAIREGQAQVSRVHSESRACLMAFIVICLVLFSSQVYPSSMRFNENSFGEKQLVRAPEFAGAKGSLLNTDKPLTIAGLKGKVVLLDFWTYGCVNCIHIIPDLERLEEKYKDQLVVIGVHSAKFKNEADTDNIRRIIIRYGIGHPVVNDADFKIWKAYAVRAWPGGFDRSGRLCYRNRFR